MSIEKLALEAVEHENKESPSPTSTEAIQTHSKTPTAMEEVKSAKDTSVVTSSSTEEGSSIVKSPVQLALISLAMGLAIFVTGLDFAIVSTAIPVITNQFGNVTDIGWYGSAYTLTTSTCQMIYGKLYKFFPVKWVFLGAVALLELGSLVCALAPNSAALIIGRAIAGCGSAGTVSGTLIIVSYSVPLHLRPAYNGMIGGLENIASIIAPLIGGVLTTYVSWRWCFYINLPIGGVTLLVIFFLFENPAGQKLSTGSLKEKLIDMNLLGLGVFIGSVVCLLLALQWGGVTYAWSSGRVVAVIVVFAVSFVVFWTLEVWKRDHAVFPGRVILHPTVILSLVYGFCTSAAISVMNYYLPLWFQAIKGASAAQSGVRILPMIIGLTVIAISVGFVVSRLGYYNPFMFLGSALMAISAGMMTTFTNETNHPAWIGWQAMFGMGAGFSFSQPFNAIGSTLKPDDIASGMSTAVFGNIFGSALFISVAQNVFSSTLRTRLEQHVPSVEPSAVLETGATDLQNLFDPNTLRQILFQYNVAVTRTFFISVGLICFHVLAAVFLPWKSMKHSQHDEDKGEDNTEAKARI